MRLVNDDIVDKAAEKGRKVARQASDAVKSGKRQARQEIEEKKSQAVAQVHDLDQALRLTAKEVDSPGMERQIERLADGVERFANALESTELEDVLQGAENFARQSPVMFVATSFAVGMACARFLRASARRTYGIDPMSA